MRCPWGLKFGEDMESSRERQAPPERTADPTSSMRRPPIATHARESLAETTWGSPSIGLVGMVAPPRRILPGKPSGQIIIRQPSGFPDATFSEPLWG